VEAVIGAFAGLALSAAVGFRVFVPLLLVGLAARSGHLELAADMAWLGSDGALVALGTATLIEVTAYYVPWLDNLLDALSTPAAMLAGVVAWAAVTPEMSPLLRWTLAVVAGGGTAGAIQAGTGLLRLHSSALTAGFGNFVIATAELTGSITLTLLALALPLLAAAIALVLLIWLGYRLAGRLRTTSGRT
jgi:hypothetical protein